MWADLTAAGTGEPVRIFVTPVAGATKRVLLASDIEEEIMIPMGSLTEPTDASIWPRSHRGRTSSAPS